VHSEKKPQKKEKESHHHHYLHFGALAALKRKRKKFSNSRSSGLASDTPSEQKTPTSLSRKVKRFTSEV
jgi:transient receptor potential cation channel subfamily C member 4